MPSPEVIKNPSEARLKNLQDLRDDKIIYQKGKTKEELETEKQKLI